MLLEPIFAVTSLEFYRKVAAQSGWRSALYLCYLSVLFSLAFTVAMKVNAGPPIDKTFDWLRNSAPPLTFVGGKITSPLTAPVTLRHPDFPQIAVVVDTNRVEPVTFQLLAASSATAYLTNNAFYMIQRPGELRAYDFSKSSDPKPVVIDAAFYDSARQIFFRVLYPAVFVGTAVFFLFWTGATTVIFALVGLLLNALAEGGLAFAALAHIALYAQTLVIGVSALGFFLPGPIPFWRLIWLAATGTYIWLAIKRVGRPQTPAPAA